MRLSVILYVCFWLSGLFQDELRFKNEKYLRAQADLTGMLDEFVQAALREQPTAAQLTGFAVDYFAVQRKQFASAPNSASNNANGTANAGAGASSVSTK